MNTISNATKLVMADSTRDEIGDGLRDARGALLSELPGVAFAFVTLAYIVTAFAQLL